MAVNESAQKIMENPELSKSLEEALRKGASKAELASMLADAGMSAEEAEDIFAEYQRKHGAVIGAQELDDEALDQVAGGNNSVMGAQGTGRCSGSFYEEACSNTVESGSWCGSNDYCQLYSETYNIKSVG